MCLTSKKILFLNLLFLGIMFISDDKNNNLLFLGIIFIFVSVFPRDTLLIYSFSTYSSGDSSMLGSVNRNRLIPGCDYGAYHMEEVHSLVWGKGLGKMVRKLKQINYSKYKPIGFVSFHVVFSKKVILKISQLPSSSTGFLKHFVSEECSTNTHHSISMARVGDDLSLPLCWTAPGTFCDALNIYPPPPRHPVRFDAFISGYSQMQYHHHCLGSCFICVYIFPC